MTFDALMVAAVRDEVERHLLGGQVQRVVQSGPLTIGLEVYGQGQRHFLVCSAEPLTARVCLAQERPVRESDVPTPFLLLLRKHVRDGRITGFMQPRHERVLVIRVAKRDASGIAGEVQVIIEAMGRRSNVLLVGSNGVILEALRRASPSRNPQRPILPGRPYLPPPPQERLDPADSGTYKRLADGARTDQPPALADVLARSLAGFSPLAAREAAYRATGDPECPIDRVDWDRVRDAVADMLEPLDTLRWTPSIAVDDGRVVAFAAYRLTHLAPHLELRSLDSASGAVEAGLAADIAPRAAAPANRELLDQIDTLETQAQRKCAALQRAMQAGEQAEELRQAGEAVLANLALIQPGQKVLHFEGRSIDLDPLISPLENAQRLFREYRKARDALRQIPELLTAAELQLQQLADLKVLAEVADSPARIRAVREELRQLAGGRSSEAPPARKGRVNSTEGQFARHRTPDGLEVLVGTSGRGNELVTFRLATGEDLWLHARGVPGAHVILRTQGREPSPESLGFAARLAARNSQARQAGRVDVDYTARKRVRKIPGAPAGLVTYSGERTLIIDPSS